MVNMHGLDVYRVGGAVRDKVIQEERNDLPDVEIEDIDYLVVGATEEEMLARGFMKCNANRFPVFIDKDNREEGEMGDEYALARTEESMGEGYKGFNVHTGPDVTIEEDLERRDLTINAMAENPDTGEIMDPHGGREDIRDGMVRHVSEAFADDPLRVLRAARFSARFDFNVAEETIELGRTVAPEIEAIDNVSIYREIVKAMKQAREPRKFFDVLRKMDALKHIDERLDKMTDVPAGPEEYHKEGDVFEHSCMVLTEMHNLGRTDPKSLLTAFFHDIGKIKTHEYDDPEKHDGHAKMGAEIMRDMGENLGMTNDHIHAFANGCKEHMVSNNIPDIMNTSTLLDRVQRLDQNEKGLTMDLLLDLTLADARGRVPAGTFDKEAAEKRIKAVKQGLDKVDAEYMDEKHGSKWRDWEGEKIGNTFRQHYVNEARKAEGEMGI